MTRDEFLNTIKYELSFVSTSFADEAVRYYAGYFMGTESDDKIIERLGNPKDAAKNYYRSHYKKQSDSYNPNAVNSENNTPDPPPKPSDIKSSLPVWLIVVICIILMPIIVPIGFFLLFMTAALLIFVVGIISAIIFGCFAMWLGGAAVIIDGLISAMPLTDRFLQAGIGFFIFGLGLCFSWLIVLAFVKLFPAVIRGIASIGRRLLNLGR